MADYYGLEAIAKRMNVNRSTILAWWRDRAFLMYRRGKAPRVVWYTNDRLIEIWEERNCLIDRTLGLDASSQRLDSTPGLTVDKKLTSMQSGRNAS